VADHPLRPATDRRLGKPLPHQLANPTSAAPKAQGPKIPCFPAHRICGISVTFATLSPTSGHVPMHYSPVRHSPPGASSRAAVRLACVRHAASVQSEPGSNSSVQSLLKLSLDVLQILRPTDFLHRASYLHLFALCLSTDNQTKNPHLSIVQFLKSVLPNFTCLLLHLAASAARGAHYTDLANGVNSFQNLFLCHLQNTKTP
jgi:hypothetical protein